jgi:hypothetical protein
MRLRNAIKARVLAIVTCLALTFSTLAVADEQEDLAKESQNPIGSILSTTILKVDGTSHRHRPSRRTGRWTVTIVGPFPLGAGSVVW